jgi:hypothetical protein
VDDTMPFMAIHVPQQMVSEPVMYENFVFSLYHWIRVFACLRCGLSGIGEAKLGCKEISKPRRLGQDFI